LGISLGLDDVSSYRSLCHQLRDIASSDPETIKVALRNRQIARVGVRHGYISDFTTGTTPPPLHCENRSSINGEYSDYTDLSMTTYRDETGTLWCLSSPYYRDVLNSKRNPFNNQALSDTTLTEISGKIQLMSQVTTSKQPVLIDTILKSLSDPDTVTDTPSTDLLNNMWSLLTTTTKKHVESLSSHTIDGCIKRIGYDARVSSLTDRHTLFTLAYLINHLNSISSPKLQVLLVALRDSK
jgi:hypothetical protein